jgi:hypothetical protein
MKQCTVRLPAEYGLNNNGQVIRVGVFGYYAVPSYQIGSHVVLYSRTDVSPNALRAGQSRPKCCVSAEWAEKGVPGNSNHNIHRHHGWRGTTNDISLDAHGIRRITKIRRLNNGVVAVTVGRDLHPEWD